MQMNKKRSAAILAFAIAAVGIQSAMGDSLFDGTVVAGETLSVTAPFGGTVKSISLRQGEWIDAGDTVASLESTKVYAPIDGAVRGIFAQPGDSAEQTVLYIAPVSKYTINASISKAYSSPETKYVNVGETVYISCTADGSHQAVGTVVSANGSNYTVETTKGELYMEEKVYLYRSQGYETTSRIGMGTVSRTGETAVSGTGSIIQMYVSDGEEVERGQLLFETVEGSLDGLNQPGSEIISQFTGAVASVNAKAGAKISKGDVLFTLYPLSGYQIAFSVPETMLGNLKEGDPLTIFFYQDDANPRQYEGTLLSLAYISDQAEESGAEASYTAYATFQPDAYIRLGMSATVSIENQ